MTLFAAMCAAHGLPTPEAEFRFHATRKWRLDYLFTTPTGERWGLEIDGGVWTHGRHTTGKGFKADIEKLNEAAIAGIRILRCTPAEVKSGAVFGLLKRAIG